MKTVHTKRTGQAGRPWVGADRCVARVVPSLLPKSSNSCQGYPSPHLSQGRASLEQIKSIKEDCLLEAPLIFVGIDVSKAQLDVAILPSAQSLSVTNDRAVIKSLIKHLKKLRPQLVVLEAAYVAPPGIISAVAGGAQLVFVTGIYRTLPYMIYGAKGIGTPAQLRGKRVGITTFGDLSDFGTRFGLRQLGLDPDKDVSLVQMGGQPIRMAALQSGAVGATILNPPYTFQARNLGLPLLIDLIDRKSTR